MATTQKDLSKMNMNFYVALISDEHGLDAMGPMHLEYSAIYNRELAKIVLPKIFAKEITSKQDAAWAKASKEAQKTANEIAAKEGTVGSEALTTVRMRKAFGNVQGEILFAPIDKNFAEEIKDRGGWAGAKIFVDMATHILKGNTMHRITEDDREGLLDEIAAGIAMEKAKAKRSARKRK